MKKHKHKESQECNCWILSDTPDEDCPQHGIGEWPPRCQYCGRFIKRRMKCQS